MEPYLQMLITVICAVLASSGFWAYLQKRREKKDNKTQMLIALAHDQIIYLAENYIRRGYITPDEYKHLYERLWEPYHLNGGNGTAARIMQDVDKLPIREYAREDSEVYDDEQ